MKILCLLVILVGPLRGIVYGQTLQVDSLFISEKDSLMLVYGTLPIMPATITVSGYELVMKNWSTTIGEFYLPVSGPGSSGKIQIASNTDTLDEWIIEEWSIPINHTFSFTQQNPQSYPQSTRSDLLLFCRLAINNSLQRCTQRCFPVSRRSSWKWNCDGSTMFDMYYTWKYSGWVLSVEGYI